METKSYTIQIAVVILCVWGMSQAGNLIISLRFIDYFYDVVEIFLIVVFSNSLLNSKTNFIVWIVKLSYLKHDFVVVKKNICSQLFYYQFVLYIFWKSWKYV